MLKLEGPPHTWLCITNQPASLQNPKCLHSTPKQLTFSRKPPLARLEKGRGLPKVTQRRFPGFLFPHYRPALPRPYPLR